MAGTLLASKAQAPPVCELGLPLNALMLTGFLPVLYWILQETHHLPPSSKGSCIKTKQNKQMYRPPRSTIFLVIELSFMFGVQRPQPLP